MHILDTLGCIVSGHAAQVSTRLTDLILDLGGKKEATILTKNKKTTSPYAALVNGSVGHHHELDDGTRLGCHPGVITIPAALAVAESTRASGKEFMMSTLLGYDVMIRIGASLFPNPSHRGFHSPALVGSFGAAVACCKLLHMKADKIANALGICSSLGPIAPFESFTSGSTVKDLYGGWPSYVGVFASLLAMSGITGPQTMFEGEQGFSEVVGGIRDREMLLGRLGRRYGLDLAYVKRHASCGLTHAPINAALEIVKKSGIGASDIEKITVKSHSLAAKCDEMFPDSEIAAKVSIPYTVAAAIIQGYVGQDVFSQEVLRDRKIELLAKKVEIVLDRKLDAQLPTRMAIVEIKTRNGKTYSVKAGEPEMKLNEVIAKFRNQTGRVFNSSIVQEIEDRVLSLERVGNIGEIVDLLRKP